MSKIEKQAVLYVFQPNTQYECKDCCYANKEVANCSYLKRGENGIRSWGSCNYWEHGSPGSLEGPHSKSKIEAGYEENKWKQGYSCKRCDEFIPETHDCEKVDKHSPGDTPGEINPNACCNRWEAHPLRASMPTSALIKLKSYK